MSEEEDLSKEEEEPFEEEVEALFEPIVQEEDKLSEEEEAPLVLALRLIPAQLAPSAPVPTLAIKKSAISALAVASKKKKSNSSSKKLSYSIGGMEINFSTTSPIQNDVYNISVVDP